MSVTLIHTPEGKLLPDDPYVVEGTRVQIVKTNPDQGWTETELGIVGVIKKNDVERTLNHRKSAKKKGLPQPDRFYATFTWHDGYEDYAYTTPECVEVLG